MCTIGLYSYPTLSGDEALLGVHVGHGDKPQSMLPLLIMLPPAADLCHRPSLGRSPQTFILCSNPTNWPQLCDLGTCVCALTARLSTLPHGFAFVFPSLCRTGSSYLVTAPP